MKFKKVFGLLLAIIMVFGFTVPTMADEGEATEQGATTTEASETETVTLHKMMFHPETKGNASITDTWKPTDIDAMKKQANYKTDQDFASEVDRLQKLMDAIPEGQTKAVPKWSGYIGQDANGQYILYKGVEIKNYDKFFGQGVTEVAGVYFQWFNKENQPLKVTYDANSTDKYTIAVASAEEASTLPPLPASLASREAGKTYLMAGLTTDHGIVFPTKGMKGDYEIREIFEKSTYTNGDKEITKTAAVPVKLTMPMVGPNGVVTDAHVYPKNTDDTPQIDKNFQKDVTKDEKGKADPEIVVKDGAGKETADSGAVYENMTLPKSELNTILGKKIPYEIKTLVPAGSHYELFSWTDSMTHGLTFQQDLMNGVKADAKKDYFTTAIAGEGGTGGHLYLFAKGTDTKRATLDEGTDYTVVQDDSSFTIELTPVGLSKIEGLDVATEFRLHYSAKINSSTVVEIPETNDVRLKYGHKPDQKHKTITPKEDHIQITKNWTSDTTEPAPEGAKATFKVYQKIEGKWVLKQTVEVIGNTPKTVEGLVAGAETRVEEVAVEGYTPEYMSFDPETGNFVVTNHKDSTTPKKGKITLNKDFEAGTQISKGTQLTFDLKEKKPGGTWHTLHTIVVKANSTTDFDVVEVDQKAATGKLPYTFENLDTTAEYTIKERASGYLAVPTIVSNDTDPVQFTLTNKKTSDNPKPKNPTEPKVSTGGKKFVKTDDTDTKTRLEGAEFIVLRKKPGTEDGSLQYLVLKNGNQVASDSDAYIAARTKYLAAYADRNKLAKLAAAETIDTKAVEAIYNKYTDQLTALGLKKPFGTDKANIQKVVALFDQEEAKEPVAKAAGILQQLERARDKAFREANMNYTWQDAAKKDSRDSKDFPNAYKLISDGDGRFEITGLSYGTYNLRELKAPEDYALMTSDVEFTVGPGSYQGTNKEVQYNKKDTNNGYGQRVENKKLTIPPTGGIGTVIFTVAGLALMAIAIIAISKKHSDDLLEEK